MIPRLPRKLSESFAHIVALSWKQKRAGTNVTYLSTEDQMKLYYLYKQVFSKNSDNAYCSSLKPFKVRKVTVSPLPEDPVEMLATLWMPNHIEPIQDAELGSQGADPAAR